LKNLQWLENKDFVLRLRDRRPYRHSVIPPAIGGTQEVHACVLKRLLAAGRQSGVQARNHWTLNETGLVTVTFTYDL
jgi:hypothetical protein